MRHHLILILTTLLLLTSCHDEADGQNVAGTIGEEWNYVDTLSAQQRQQQIEAELAYYLERHDPKDEGYDAVMSYLTEPDTTLHGFMQQGGALPYYKIGHWGGHSGNGVWRDRQGRLVMGDWQGDSLLHAVRLDSAGVFAGAITPNQEAVGEGRYWGVDGSHYRGEWVHDQREGFGLQVAPDMLRVGQWRWDGFRGERLTYHPDRVYGIDISRYQHEQGRRRYSIDWRRLRITHLGRRIGQERIEGNVSYPVTFVYIKSTQGTSIVSRYYAADYQNARRHQLRAGAYHFFSTTVSGREQARHYLLNTQFNKGDMPPMLDIEPSDRQIEQMGGGARMWEEARQWLQAVEKATGCRPIIYCSQNFAKTYLPFAPDIERDYLFWIARYGEFKPDLHMHLWQSSCDGRVEGIRGHVDLNVFNGYRQHWEDFLREKTVK